MRLAGVGDEELSDSVYETAKSRWPWLFINTFTALLASTVIGMFGATIEQMVALAVLMPIVASMGGNAGTQTMTVTVRALATKRSSASSMSPMLVGLGPRRGVSHLVEPVSTGHSTVTPGQRHPTV